MAALYRSLLATLIDLRRRNCGWRRYRRHLVEENK
jgi:hypothetical protein